MRDSAKLTQCLKEKATGGCQFSSGQYVKRVSEALSATLLCCCLSLALTMSANSALGREPDSN